MTGAMIIHPLKPLLRDDVIESLLEQANANAEVINKLWRENSELYQRVAELERINRNANARD